MMPLGPVLTGIIMVELETKVVPIISNCTLNWNHFVADTIGYVTNDKVVSEKLNSFHENTQFPSRHLLAQS